MSKYFTQAQLSEFKGVFSIYDRDSDGKLSIKELEHLIRFLGLSTQEKEIKDMINEVNSQEEALIPFEAFLLLMAKQIKDADTPEIILEAFKVFDDDHDGLIKVEDFRSYLKGLEEKLADEEIDEIINMADFDKKGFINYSELVKMKMSQK